MKKGTTGTHWTAEEEFLLKEYYFSSSRECMVKILPKRGWPAIQGKAFRLGIRQQSEWMFTEDQYLKENYAVISKQQMIDFLPGRTWIAIRNRAKTLGLKRRFRWTSEKNKYLQENHLKLTTKEIGKEVGATPEAVRTQSRKLGLYKFKSIKWTIDEIAFLVENHQNSKVLREHFSYRSWDGIRLRLKLKGLYLNSRKKASKWTPKEIEILRKHYGQTSKETLQSFLPQRTWETIRVMAHKIKLNFNRKKWTEEEVEILRQTYPNSTRNTILEALEWRWKWARITDKAHNLGIKRSQFILYSENLLFNILDQIFGSERHKSHARPKWLRNPQTGRPLELDRYYPQLNIAFEYNGEQHYKLALNFTKNTETAQNRLFSQQYRDNVKKEICLKQGVSLIVVKYTDTLTAENIKRIIENANV